MIRHLDTGRVARILAFLCVLSAAALLTRLMLSQGSAKVQLISDFEARTDLTDWRGPIRLSSSHPSHGKSCLEAQFDSNSSVLSVVPQDGNWGAYERLLFDAYNPERDPVILSFRLYDAVGGDPAKAAPQDLYRADRKLFLGSGWTHVEVSLKNLQATSELRPLALEQIRTLTLAADAGTLPLSVFFDNFRLVRGAEGDSTASREAPQDITTRLEGRRVTILQVGPRDKIPESDTVQGLRKEARREYEALKQKIESSEIMGLDTIYSRAELVIAELGLDIRPLLAWFNNDREKERMFRFVAESCRRERERLERLLTGEVGQAERDDTQIPGPLVPPYPRLHGLAAKGSFFVDQDGRPLFVISLHGPSQGLQRFFATPVQHIESYSVGGGSRWTVDTSPVYEAFKKFPDTHRIGWDGWCGHLIRDLNSMGGKKENVVICLESPHVREAVEGYIRREVGQWLKNPDLLYNIMAYELQYICYCERSQQMFRTWLEKKHGNPGRLNQVWGTHYNSFQDITAPPTKNARPLPATNRAQWYDWALFNQDRFSDYLVWVKSVIRRYDPVTPLAAGGSFSMLHGGNGTSGIDEEQIINRVDDVIIHEGSGSTLGMDLQMALSETPKPLCDPEMNLQDVRYLLPYLLHGKSVVQLWHWPDQPPAEYPHLINDSLAHGWKFSLEDVAALFRAVLDARRLSKEIASFSVEPAQVAILYSRTSVVQIPPEMLTWRTTPYLRELENTYEASRFLDVRTTFVSEKQILAGRLSQFRVLVVPAVSHTRAEVVDAVNHFVERGGTLLTLPSSFLSEEYNRTANYLPRLGVQVHRIVQPEIDRTGEVEQAYDQTLQERVVYRPIPAEDLIVRKAGPFAQTAPTLQAEGTRQDIAVSGTHEQLATFSDGRPALVSIRRGLGVLYYSATGFPRQSLGRLLDYIFDAARVDRPVRVRGENGGLLKNVEARFVSGGAGKLLYVTNFNDNPVEARVEFDGGLGQGLFELRRQQKLPGEGISVPAGETLIFRID